MPTQSRSRKQIRQDIGSVTGLLDMSDGGLEHSVSQPAENTVTVRDDSLAFGGDDEYRGWWTVVTTDGTAANVGQIRRIFSSDPEERSLTWAVPIGTTATDSTLDYELWKPEVSPVEVNNYINQAITEATRRGSVSIESDTIHTGGNVREWGLSTTIVGLQIVEYRSAWTGENLTTMDGGMSSFANAVAEVDTEDFREGAGSAKVTIESGASSASSMAASSFAAVDLRGTTHSETWIKTNVTSTSNSRFTITLQEGDTVRETITVPALTADSWNYLTTALSNAEIDSAISRVVLNTGTSDGGSATIWLDDVKAVRTSADRHRKIPDKFWTVGKANRSLQFKADAPRNYAKLRVTGVRKPALLTTDSAVCDIESQYVVNSATAKTLRARGDRRRGDRDAAYEMASEYEGLAQAQRARLPSPQNVKWLS